MAQMRTLALFYQQQRTSYQNEPHSRLHLDPSGVTEPSSVDFSRSKGQAQQAAAHQQIRNFARAKWTPIPSTACHKPLATHTESVTPIKLQKLKLTAIKKKPTQTQANLGPHCWSPLLTSGWNNAEGHSLRDPCKTSARPCHATSDLLCYARRKHGQDGLKAGDDHLSLKVPKSTALLSHR